MTEVLPYRVRFEHWLPRLFGHDAVTLRKTVYTRLTPSQFDGVLHAHEYAHVVQWQRYGVILFLGGYVVGLLAHGYRHHPYEVEATAWAELHAVDFKTPFGTIP